MSRNPPSRAPVVVAREPMYEQIVPHIRRDIIEGRWAPSERLAEPLLCSEFGISRTPLRDALKLLEAEGMIELVPHVGAVVTNPSPADVAERMEVLCALEQMAASKVARERTAKVLRGIVALHERMIAAARKNDASSYYRLNDEFHRAIVLGAKNATLADLHEHIMWHVHRARHRANQYEGIDEGAAAHHERIVRALVDGNPNDALQAMAEHLGEVSTTIVSHTAD